MKNNEHKKRVFQDDFIKRWCCSSDNHPSGWHWWKKKVRKKNRLVLKQELLNEQKDERKDIGKVEELV